MPAITVAYSEAPKATGRLALKFANPVLRTADVRPRRSEGLLSAQSPLRDHCSIQLPQVVEPMRCRPRVVRCVPGVSVAEVVLDDPQIAPLVGQGETAGMA